MRKRSKWYLIEFIVIVFVMLGIIGKYVVEVDPFFHYHRPHTDQYYYTLDNERSQNDGISKRFEYNMLITGTSMTQCFKTSEADEIWAEENVSPVKVSYSGASYKEINENLKRALKHNENLNIIIRGLDMVRYMDDKDLMRKELGAYPTYLYDEYIWNDVEYIFNREVVFDRVYPMLTMPMEPGITSFDDYSNWMSVCTFGAGEIIDPYSEIPGETKGNAVHMTEADRETLLGNIRQNVTSLAEEYPNVTFYYFFTPYSVAWWGKQVQNGNIYRQVEAERLVIEEILKCENIKLYSFNNRTDITTDLNNYKDDFHYGEWINSLMLRWMHDGKYQITEKNYEAYLAEEQAFYTSYDYASMAEQTDYENDYYAEAVLMEEMYGVSPLTLTDKILHSSELESAHIIEGEYQDTISVECIGCLEREPDDERPLPEYLMEDEYIGCKVTIEDISDYRYFVFYGRKESGDGQPGVFLYDDNDQVVAECIADCRDLDNEWHQYLIDITDLDGSVTIIFNGGYTDNTGSEYTAYVFGGLALY